MKKYFILLSLTAMLFAFTSCEEDRITLDRLGRDGAVNGYDYVDLGLSVKWATYNVGASSPEEYGDYFAWGETSPKKIYDSTNCVTWDVTMFSSIAGNPQYDAATANWGDSWRMPTVEEVEELIRNTMCEFATLNGVRGTLLTSEINGKSIFMPHAGYRDGSSLYNAGEDGSSYFWIAEPHSSYGENGIISKGAYCFRAIGGYDIRDRYYGRSVRPVTE